MERGKEGGREEERGREEGGWEREREYVRDRGEEGG